MPEAFLFWGGAGLFATGAVVRIAAAVTRLARRGHGAPDPAARALRVLAERYAAGEIDRHEYFEKRSALEY